MQKQLRDMGNFKLMLFAVLVALLFFNCKDEAAEKDSSRNEKASIENQKEVLLIGTFHYNNPGADVAKTKSFDILNDKTQEELDFIAGKISAFKPSKIFVEWSHDEQPELDSLYNLYKHDNYFTNDSLSEFYLKNEIFQLAFKTGKRIGLPQVNGIDYRTEFPFDSLMIVLEKNHQIEIQSKIGELIETFTDDFDEKIEKGESLLDLTYYLNTRELREMSNEFHNQIPLIAGPKDNFIGPFLTAEWYKRNLYMWSLVQKGTENRDERIMVLVGASHAAVIKNFIDENNAWRVVELKSVIED